MQLLFENIIFKESKPLIMWITQSCFNYLFHHSLINVLLFWHMSTVCIWSIYFSIDYLGKIFTLEPLRQIYVHFKVF